MPLAFWDGPRSVYGMCFSLSKSTSYLLLCLSLNFFCHETSSAWASLSPETRCVILFKRLLVQVPIWVAQLQPETSHSWRGEKLGSRKPCDLQVCVLPGDQGVIAEGIGAERGWPLGRQGELPVLKATLLRGHWVRCRLTNLFWFVQTFPGFSTENSRF